MASQSIVDENDRGSPHYVAWLLLMGIARNEEKLSGGGKLGADREWILKAYQQCLDVAHGGRAQIVLSDQ